MATVGEGGTAKDVMDQYRFSSYADRETAALAAQICVANLVKAFDGVISEKRIRKAVGNANSPNAVSRAARARLPHL